MSTVWADVRAALRADSEKSQISAPEGAWAPLVAEIGDAGSVLVVTATGRQAEELAERIRQWTDRQTAYFPAWETLPHERLSPSADIVGTRMSVLRRVRTPDLQDSRWGPIDIVVAPVRALMQPLAPGILDEEPLRIVIGAELELTQTATRLVELGYERCDLVERRGQFALRGGIVDVFPPGEDHPVRAELWGDTVEDVRSFAVSDQRTMTKIDRQVLCLPCRELLATAAVRDAAAKVLAKLPADSAVTADLSAIADGQYVGGMESLAALVFGRMESAVEVLAPQRRVVVVAPERVESRSVDAMRTADEFGEAAWGVAGSGGAAPMMAAEGSLIAWEELQVQIAASAARIQELSAFVAAADLEDGVGVKVAEPNIRTIGPFTGPSQAFSTIEQAIAANWRVLIAASGAGSANRLAELFAERDIPTRISQDGDLASGVAQIAVGSVSDGFRIPSASLAVLADSDFSRRSRRARKSGTVTRLPTKRRRQEDPLSLSAGDIVVHEKHGVGRFVELNHRESRGAMREFLVVEYAPSKRGFPPDQLYIPSDQLQSVSRYVGGEQPALSKLGGSDWARAKGRARKAVKEIAGELVRLYAARQSAPGYAFGPDTVWQTELEDAFEYLETPDQQSGIDEVKADMEKPVPMDRLICGDVGYGKTEIAIRAAFKAVQDGKQVVILVPTTLLVQQHMATFLDRFGNFPVNIAALSRFQTAKEAKKVIAGIVDGKVDVVIGTHRLLTTNVRFKDLGLVIVDEEQRFGVEHKEHLKALRSNVDMLTMSATPIPRTLEMAVTGIREMSTIATPPEDRLPVLTYVGPYEERQLRAAIHRELLRDGQIFFVHNRVDSIDKTAQRIRELVPEARVSVAHGRMGETALERVVVDFWEGNIDILVCTTIVESGIDIANANTLIVDRAENFGLSQLHQLRGRVGRSSSRAYAYFLHSPDKALSETAHERLTTIAQNSDLGSGMQIALKDLEIRGAGNLLGGEQSGHIADVGFDLYLRMVGEALAEHKGESTGEDSEVRVDLPIDAHIPQSYVSEERLRLEAYQRLAAAVDQAQIAEVVAELNDRYGPLPPEANTLVDVARFRVVAKRAGLSEVVQAGNRVRFHPVELPDSRQIRLSRLYRGSVVKPATRQILVPLPTDGGKPISGAQVLDWASRLVKTVLLDESVTDGSTSR
jgi:transcription-repair coupling factor (superfamily II helicase)